MKSIVSAGTFGSILGVLREVDVRPMRTSAETPFVLALLSQDVALAQHLADLLYRGLRQNDIPPARVCGAFPLGIPASPQRMDIAVIVTREDRDNSTELQLLRTLEASGVHTLVCLIADPSQPPPLRQQWLPTSIVALSTIGGSSSMIDDAAATQQLVRAIRGLKAVDDLALARHLPAFRDAVARGLIDDTALANAVYSLGTGLLEMNPVADVPMNLADIVVLTKNQALMAYKTALAMGLTADFGQIMPQLAAVVGVGFLLRQTARGLIGLVPGFGIIPKIAVAFAGTYATGEVIYRWCAFGEKVAGQTLRNLYDIALERGRMVASNLLKKRDREPGTVQPRANLARYLHKPAILDRLARKNRK